MKTRIPQFPVIGAVSALTAGLVLGHPSAAHANVTYKGGSVKDFLASDTQDAKTARDQFPTAKPDEVETIVTGYAAGGTPLDITDPVQLGKYVALDYKFLVDKKVETGSLNAFLAEQRELERHIASTPATFERRIITAGFEHEFLKHHTADSATKDKIANKGCDYSFTEVDHAELIKTGAYMNDLPFIIETDSDNELELVTPPFFLATSVPGVPLPSYAEVIAYEKLMGEKVLKDINTAVAQRTNQKNPMKFPELVTKLRNTGIPFPNDLQPVDIDATALTHRTPVVPPSAAPEVSVDKLKNVCLRSAKKDKTLIGHQLNFATDALTFTALEYFARDEGDYDNDWLRLWLAILPVVRQNAPPNPSTEMKAFLLQYAATAANQAAVPAMGKYLEYVKGLAAHPDQARQRADDEALENWEGLPSYVKDWSVFWLKTSLYNFGRSLLDQNQWTAVVTMSDPNGALAQQLATALQNKSLSEFYEDQTQLADAARTAITGFPGRVKTRFDGKYNDVLDQSFKIVDDKTNQLRRIQIYEHNDRDLGPRQDTYVGPDKVRMAAWPNVILHLVEDREERSHPSLKALDKKLNHSGADPTQIIKQRIDWLWELHGLTVPSTGLKDLGEESEDDE